MAELRVELPEFTIAVLDGYCSASGKCRTEQVKQILGDWAQHQHHVASVVLKVAGSNPTIPDRERK